MSNALNEAENLARFPTVSPASFQQYLMLLLERVVPDLLPELAGMMRLSGRWTDPGKPSGKYYYGAKIVDDGGAQAKVEIPVSLIESRGIQPGQQVVLTGRLVVRFGNYGIEVKLSATDIELGQQEKAAQTAVVQQGRMSLERLLSIEIRQVSFPDQEPCSIALIQSISANAQVAQDCMAELNKLGNAVEIVPKRINMLDPVAIVKAISESDGNDIVMLIRGGGDAADFEVFDDPRVVNALAEQRAYRIVGLGHTGNNTLLDLVADYSANTPAQAGVYVRERIARRQQFIADLRVAKERVVILERERNIAQSQEKRGYEYLQARIPLWAIAAVLVVGGVLISFRN